MNNNKSVEEIINDLGWERLDDRREMKKLNGGDVILVAPKSQREYIVPLFCPLCEFPMKTREDAEAFLDCRTCDPCKKEWKEIEPIDFSSENWVKYRERRKLLAKTIINIR